MLSKLTTLSRSLPHSRSRLAVSLPLLTKRRITSPNPLDHKPTLPPSPPPGSGAMNPPEGSSKLFLPGGIAAAVGLGFYVWTRDTNEVTGGDVTKGPKDGQPSRMAG